MIATASAAIPIATSTSDKYCSSIETPLVWTKGSLPSVSVVHVLPFGQFMLAVSLGEQQPWDCRILN
jgi:hypothetical protein